MNKAQLIDNFIEEINSSCFPFDNGGNKKSKEREFLQLRFDPKNYEPKLIKNTEIAEQMSKKLEKSCQYSITTTCQTVVRAIARQYESEMVVDGVDVNKILNRHEDCGNGRGKKGHWETVYAWLHDRKFPRWRTNWIWQNWQIQARSNRDWISFLENDSIRGMVVPTPPQNQQIVVDRSLIMQIDIQDCDRYLLLLNRGKNDLGSQTRYLVCPSQAFAPKLEPVANLQYLPQSGAICQDIKFDTTGQEEYIGIVVNELPDGISWLTPSAEEPAPIWDEARIYELWQELEKQTDCQVFYQSFEVVVSQNHQN